MKHLPIILFLIALVLFLSSCNREQESLFEQPAAIRLNEAIYNTDSILVSATNGWIMHYFATNESPGYPILTKFEKTGEVLAAAKNKFSRNKYAESKSLFEIIGDNGPVLSFNSYNNIIHAFSNPENPAGHGQGGDYEFIINNISDSLIKMSGKKTKTSIELYKAPENINWSNLFEQLDNMNNKIIGDDVVYLISGNDTTILSGTNSFVFEIEESQSKQISYLPFIITLNGIKLYEPFETKRKTYVQHFTLSAEGDKLIAESDNQTYITGSNVIDFLISSNQLYEFDLTQTSEHFFSPANLIYEQLHSRYSGNRDVDYLAIGYHNGFGFGFSISTKPTLTIARYQLYLLKQNNQSIKINREPKVFDQNGEIFYNNNTAIEDFWKTLPGTYELKTTLSKNSVTFIDIENELRYFTANKKTIE
jgi:hypothetical protein